MKHIPLLMIIVLLSFSGYGQQPGLPQEQNTICDNPNCVKYLKIWKDLFMKKGGMSEEYFNKHIHVTRTNTYVWNGGECFNVWYDITIDWMTYNVSDHLAINISNSEDPELTLPRNKYLTESEVDEIVSKYPFISNIHFLSPEEHLKYASMDAAVAEASAKAENRKAREKGSFWFYNLYPGIKNDGHPYLRLSYEISGNENKCMDQKLDLITGESINENTFCYGIK